MSDDNWFADWFDRDYLMVYGHRDERDARAGVDLLERALGSVAGLRVLDLACGPGRHARELAARGARVTGVDLSPVLLAEAARAGAPRGGLVRGDMRALPFRTGAFDRIACFFTSFGYFDDAGNRAVLEQAHRVLAPGGGLLLDVLNRDPVVAHLEPETSRRLGSTIVLEARRYDAASGRLIKDIEIQDLSETRSRRESVRLYSPEELVERLSAAGFDRLEAWGSLDGARFDPQRSLRLVVTARSR